MSRFQIEFQTWWSLLRTFLISLRGSSDLRSNAAQFTPQRSPSTRASLLRIFNFFHAFLDVNSTSDARQEILPWTILQQNSGDLMRAQIYAHFYSAQFHVIGKHTHQQISYYSYFHSHSFFTQGTPLHLVKIDAIRLTSFSLFKELSQCKLP